MLCTGTVKAADLLSSCICEKCCHRYHTSHSTVVATIKCDIFATCNFAAMKKEQRKKKRVPVGESKLTRTHSNTPRVGFDDEAASKIGAVQSDGGLLVPPFEELRSARHRGSQPQRPPKVCHDQPRSLRVHLVVGGVARPACAVSSTQAPVEYITAGGGAARLRRAHITQHCTQHCTQQPPIVLAAAAGRSAWADRSRRSVSGR